MSGYSADYVRDKLTKELQTEHFEIEDNSDGCGAKFICVIVSKAFEGQPLLKRHRMVNAILAEELKIIHAFQMTTLTPDEWAKRQAQKLN